MKQDIDRNMNSCRGMSLVELLVVMTILSVVMLAVMSLYVPAHQSTVAQTQVSDVNANLRLALNVMTRDLLTAGFLEPRYPIVFPDASPNFTDETLTDRGTKPTNGTDFIIRTRAVGDGFARIESEPSWSGNLFTLSIAESDMVSNFPTGAKFRVFGAMNGNELVNSIDSAVSSANRVFTVDSYNSSTIVGDISSASLTTTEKDDLKEIMTEGVMIRVRDNSQPTLQTIRYRLNDGALERIINGNIQRLARNLSAVSFNFEDNDQDRVKLVNIRLTGATRALKNDAISGQKVRQVETSVRLRNVY